MHCRLGKIGQTFFGSVLQKSYSKIVRCFAPLHLSAKFETCTQQAFLRKALRCLPTRILFGKKFTRQKNVSFLRTLDVNCNSKICRTAVLFFCVLL